MKYTFIGHQSWLVEDGTSKVLLDPLLEDTFGTDNQFGIEVVPPRKVMESAYKNIDAVILSHEHSDHFHIQSLNKIDRTTPIYVGILTIEPMVRCIEAMGFIVYLLKSRDKISIGTLDFTAYQAHPKTAIWESRVYQFLFHSNLNDYSIFIAVDALISKDFETDVIRGEITRPDSIMISNNSQIPPKGVLGSLDNASIPEAENKARVGALGLRLVKGIIIDYSDIVHDLEHIVLCGGGFMKSGDTFGEFMMSNQGKVAALATPLFPEKNVQGAIPGMIFENNNILADRSDSIVPNTKRENELKAKFKAFSKNPEWGLRSMMDDVFDLNECCSIIINAFQIKHIQIMASDFGRLLVSVGEPNNCFEVCLLSFNQSEERRYNYNWQTNEWSTLQLEKRRPFGIRAIAADFAQVATGDIQIWDIAGLAINTWYDPSLGNNPIKYSPMGLIYSIFGEHFNIEHFEKQCEKQWFKILDEGGLC